MNALLDIPTGLLELSQQYTEWALKKKVEHLIKKGLSTDNVAGLYGVATKFDAKVFILCAILGVPNHCTPLWAGMVEWSMEWTMEYL